MTEAQLRDIRTPRPMGIIGDSADLRYTWVQSIADPDVVIQIDWWLGRVQRPPTLWVMADEQAANAAERVER